jgi:uncharacterized phage-associated protein
MIQRRWRQSMKREKQINALLYALEEYPDIGRVKLMKFVFLADLVMYNHRGETLLEDEYIRMPHGPVPPVAYALTSGSNAYFTVSRIRLSPDRFQYRFQPAIKADRTLFSREEKNVFTQILEILRKNTATAISTLTHRLSLWKNVENGHPIPLELFQLKDDEFPEPEVEPLSVDDTDWETEVEKAIELEGRIDIPETALMSERSLAIDWMRTEEDAAWEYL